MALTSNLLMQAGVIALRGNQICLVTSRSGRRWVVPKGCMEPGRTGGEIALVEAWEEAGLVGLLNSEPVGSYLYDKSECTCHVTLFQLKVTEVAADWPEREFRDRCWVSLTEALARVEEPGLRKLIRELQEKSRDR